MHTNFDKGHLFVYIYSIYNTRVAIISFTKSVLNAVKLWTLNKRLRTNI